MDQISKVKTRVPRFRFPDLFRVPWECLYGGLPLRVEYMLTTGMVDILAKGDITTKVGKGIKGGIKVIG